jgi:hypothetical protein
MSKQKILEQMPNERRISVYLRGRSSMTPAQKRRVRKHARRGMR